MTARTRRLVAAAATAAVVLGAVVGIVTRERDDTAGLAPLAGPAPGAYATPSATPTPTESATPDPDTTIEDRTPSPPPGDYDGRAGTADPERPSYATLPTACISFGHACAYDGATGANTGGVETFTAKRVGPTSVRLTWSTLNLAGQANRGPVVQFIANAYLLPAGNLSAEWRDPYRLRRVRLSTSTFSYTFDGLKAGETYAFWVQELNSSGLSPGMGGDPMKIPPAPTTPPPTTAPAPTPTASPTADPTADPTSTPSATGTP